MHNSSNKLLYNNSNASFVLDDNLEVHLRGTQFLNVYLEWRENSVLANDIFMLRCSTRNV